MQHLPQHKKIILFDGRCNLCNASVKFIIKRDSKDVFRFVSLQSDMGRKILGKLPLKIQKTDSIILFESDDAYFYKSEAIFEIAKSIGIIFYCLLIFRLIPTIISDKIYDHIAQNRYRWFGKKENCLLPTKDLVSKFLS